MKVILIECPKCKGEGCDFCSAYHHVVPTGKVWVSLISWFWYSIRYGKLKQI